MACPIRPAQHLDFARMGIFNKIFPDRETDDSKESENVGDGAKENKRTPRSSRPRSRTQPMDVPPQATAKATDSGSGKPPQGKSGARRSNPPAIPTELPRTGSAAIGVPTELPRTGSAAIGVPTELPRTGSAPIAVGRSSSSPIAAGRDPSAPITVGRDPAVPIAVGREASSTIVVRPPALPSTGSSASPDASSSSSVGQRSKLGRPPARPAPHSGRTPSPRARGDDKAASDGELDEDIDAAFDDAQQTGSEKPEDGKVPNDVSVDAELQRLFGEIAAHHTAQLRDFAMELELGEPGRQWAEICLPAVASLRNAANTVGNRALAVDLRAFEKSLDRAGRGEARIAGSLRDELLERYRKLRQVLPAAFDVASDRDRREPVIVHALLAQVPGVHSLALQRLYAAGLVGLDALYRASVEELQAVTGVAPSVCKAIVQRFAAYREHRALEPPQEGHTRERQRLAGLLDRLEAVQGEFLAAEEDEDKIRKRAARARRNALVAEVDLLLAHIGEAALAGELRRLSVQRKIERVREFLHQTTQLGARTTAEGQASPRG